MMSGSFEKIRSGELFAFSAVDGQTNWEKGLVGRVSGKALELKLPYDGGALLFDEEPDGIYGDCFVAGKTRAALADACTLLIDGDFLPIGLPSAYEVAVCGARAVLAPREVFDSKWLDDDFDKVFQARKRWLDGQNYGSNPVLRRALSQLKTQLCSPEGIIKRRWTTPDRWPHRRMWLWDSVFHALALRHVDADYAKDSIRAVFDGQLPNGFVPHMASPTDRSNVTQPPVLAYGIAKILEKDDDVSFLAELYPKNKAFLNWCAANRDKDGAGLLEWFIEGDKFCRCGESGMDNSCRFDAAVLFDAPDFNAFYAQECLLMADFAKRLSLTDDAAMWQSRLEKINRLMNERLWDDDAGLYVDYDIATGKRSPILSSAGFLPMLSGAPTADMVARMVTLIRDSQKFGTILPLPSVARDTPDYSCDMWRGPVWTNINMLVAEGLERYGYDDLASEIIAKTQAVIEKYFDQYGTFFEFYDADDVLPPCRLDRKGPNNIYGVFNQPLRDYGWTATLYIDRCFRDRRGL